MKEVEKLNFKDHADDLNKYAYDDESIEHSETIEFLKNNHHIVSSKHSGQKIFGILAAMFFAFSESSSATTFKLSAWSAPMLLLYSCSLRTLLGIALMCLHNESIYPRSEDCWPLFFRVLCAGSALPIYYSVTFIAVAEASVIIFSYPIFAMIFARVFLKEKFGIFEFVIAILTILGVFIVLDVLKIMEDIEEVTTMKSYIIGCSLALIAALGKALATVSMKRLQHLHYSVLLFWGGVGSLIFSIVLMVITSKYEIINSVEEITIASITAICFSINIIFLIFSLKYLSVGEATNVAATEVIFSGIYQVMLFNQCVSISTATGGTIISSSIIILTNKQRFLNCIDMALRQIGYKPL